MPEIFVVLRNVCAGETSIAVLLIEAETSVRRGSFCLQHECGKCEETVWCKNMGRGILHCKAPSC